MRTISGLAKVTGIVRSFGWVRLNETLSFGVAWMLCSRRSLLRKSTVPPAGTTTTRGMNTQPFWSISTLAAGAGAAAPAGGFSSQTTAFLSSLRGDSNKSPESFSVPHTYWSIVTSSFFGAGAGPPRITEPLIEPAALTPVAPRPTSSSDAATVNCIPLMPTPWGGCGWRRQQRFDRTGSGGSSVARGGALGQDGSRPQRDQAGPPASRR